MTKLYKRIATSIATSAMLLANAFPVIAATELQIVGNGSDSENAVVVQHEATTFVTQTNNTQINNDVQVKTDTGNNTASDNTAGDVYIETGDTTANVTIDNVANNNVAEVESCDCADDASVLIEGNGSGSENNAVLEKANNTVLTQTNVAQIDNDVDVKMETGDNQAEDNTGGDVVIVSGDADSSIEVTNTANMNYASITPAGDGGEVSLIIRENGSDSDNAIALGLSHVTWLDQLNVTSIGNDVDVDADTGNNEAEDNTGGTTGIGTGDVTVDVMLDSMAGFNAANIEDCCFEDIFAKVGMNGTDTENVITAVLADDLTVWQDNVCGGDFVREDSLLLGSNHHSRPCFDNEVDVEAATGDNTNEDNTGSTDGDPMIVTGDSDTTVEVSNQGGSNAYGVGSDSDWDWDFPSMGFDFSFSFDLQDLLAALN